MSYPELEATIELLNKIPREELHEIGEKAELSYQWLVLFRTRKIKEPGYQKIVRLQNALADIAAQ